MKVSDFNPKKIDSLADKVVSEYQTLDYHYNTDKVLKNLRTKQDKNHMGRDRYSDIRTYHTTRVKLSQGNSLMSGGSDYINACFINSPFPKPNAQNGIVGDCKIIAS